MASVFCCATLLGTFFISRKWHREKYDRKHLLFVMSLLTMLFAVSMSFLSTEKSPAFCRIQASLIHAFGVASVVYAAAVSADTYYYIIGFSKQYENESLNNDIASGTAVIEGGASSIAKHIVEEGGGSERSISTTITGLSKENLDYYNRDTEVSMSSVNDLGMGSPSGLSFSLGPGMTVFDIDYASRSSQSSRAGAGTTASADSSGSGRTWNCLCSWTSEIAEQLPRKYVIFHAAVALFMLLALLVLNLAPGSHPTTYLEPGFICYFNETWLIPLFGLLPIVISIFVIAGSNFFMVRNVITFYSAAMRGAAFTDRDSNSSDYLAPASTSASASASASASSSADGSGNGGGGASGALHAVRTAIECVLCSCCRSTKALFHIMSRLDNDGGKEFRRIIIYPLYYLTNAVVFIFTALVKRSVTSTSSDASIIDVQVCLALVVGVGNSIIWVFSDSAIMRQWRHFLHSKFILCNAHSDRLGGRTSSATVTTNGNSVETPVRSPMVP